MASSPMQVIHNIDFTYEFVHTRHDPIVPAGGAKIYNLPPTIPNGYELFSWSVQQVGAANGWCYHVFCPDENYKLVVFNRYTSSVDQPYSVKYTYIKIT